MAGPRVPDRYFHGLDDVCKLYDRHDCASMGWISNLRGLPTGRLRSRLRGYYMVWERDCAWMKVANVAAHVKGVWKKGC